MNRRSLSVIQILAIFLIIPSLTFGQQFPTSERVVGPTETDLVLTVRLSPNVKAETLALLNQSTVPRIVRLEKNKNLKVLLSSIYGAFLPRIKSEVRALNPWLPANDYNDLLLNATSELKLPAGGEYYTNVIKAATRETNFPQQARLETGTDTKEIVSRIHQTTNSFKNFFKNFCRTRECTVPQKAALATQRSIAFPFVSRYVSFTLKPEVASQAGVLLEKLKTDSAVIDAEIHSPSKLISHVNDSSLAAAGPGCGSEPLERDWFIHSLSLDKLPIDVLRGNNATTIAIMDSGIVHNDKRFELWQNIPEANGLEGTDDDVNGYVDDTVGCNFIMQSDFPFDDQFGLDYRNHGTHVTGLASGRFLAEPLATAITQRVRPMVLKIADSSGFVDNGGVNDAIVYAQN